MHGYVLMQKVAEMGRRRGGRARAEGAWEGRRPRHPPLAAAGSREGSSPRPGPLAPPEGPPGLEAGTQSVTKEVSDVPRGLTPEACGWLQGAVPDPGQAAQLRHLEAQPGLKATGEHGDADDPPPGPGPGPPRRIIQWLRGMGCWTEEQGMG